MTQQSINIGISPNDKSGDPIRTAFNKVNQNFTELYAGQVNSDWNAVAGIAQILNKPAIPAAQVNSDWAAVAGVSQILNKPTTLKVVTAPIHSYGIAGDVANSIAYDAGYLYVCKTNYVDDLTDIWVRISLTAGTW